MNVVNYSYLEKDEISLLDIYSTRINLMWNVEELKQCRQIALKISAKYHKEDLDSSVRYLRFIRRLLEKRIFNLEDTNFKVMTRASQRLRYPQIKRTFEEQKTLDYWKKRENSLYQFEFERREFLEIFLVNPFTL